MNFSIFFLLLWVIFALVDPDPDSEYGSGFTDPIESGSNPDPQPCLEDTGKIVKDGADALLLRLCGGQAVPGAAHHRRAEQTGGQTGLGERSDEHFIF
jgi:hypothetical protein